MTTTPIQPGAQPFVQQAPPVQTAQPPVGTTTTTAAPYVIAPAPYGQRYETTTETRPNRALLSLGMGLFVVSYGASVVVAAVSDRDEDKRLFIPLVGPWVDLGERNCSERTCGNQEAINKAMILASGIVQDGAVLLALGSLFIPETVHTQTTVGSAASKPTVRITPMSYGAGAGIGAVGRF
jgi:hypothetical protein